MRRLSFAVLSVFLLAGCNTMMKGQYQKVTVHTPGVINADCYLETQENKYRMLTPGSINIDRSRFPLTVYCEKAGYVPAQTVVESKLRAAGTQLNALNGLVLGAAYDFSSNSVFAYPDSVTLMMEPKPVVQLETVEVIPYVTEKKSDKEVKVEPPADAPAKGEAEKTMSKSLRK